MTSFSLLSLYGLLVVGASLAGGWVPLVVRLTHRRMQVAISFVSGIILGIGLLHMVPHSLHELGSIDRTMAWVMGGFLFMFFLERFFHFHHHDVADDDQLLSPPVEHAGDHDHDHAGHAHAHHDHHHGSPGASNFSWLSAAVGLTLHSLVDGVAIAAAVRAEDGNEAVTLAGLGVFLAVFLHKPFDALTIGTLMAAAGSGKSSRHAFNALYALITPLGIVLFYALASSSGASPQALGAALGFAGGAFVCIATSDLLPELQFHRHDRLLLTSALVLGIGLAWGTMFLEGEHVHGHSHEHETEHHDDEHTHDHSQHEGHKH